MIRGFEQTHLLPAEDQGHLQWSAALGAALIAGAILLIVPRGSPWSELTFFSPAIMGRALAPGYQLSLAAVWFAHLGISILYGLIISLSIARLTQARAVFVGGFVGLILYVLNWAAVKFLAPSMRGNELSVLFTHVVFGLIAAGACRGLLKRKKIA